MKKVILVFIICLGFCVVNVSCKENKKEKTEQSDITEDDHKDIAQTAYKCPMDCEKGKTYEEEGKCPVCKMDLRKSKETHDEKEGQKK